MPAPDVSGFTSTDELPTDLVEIGIYPTFAAGSDRGLVVLAMGGSYWLIPADTGFSLRVEATHSTAVREQLARFERESVGWPPPPLIDSAPEQRTGRYDPVLWLIATVAVFSAQTRMPELAERGMLDPAKLFAGGEWWRIATALFLHADAVHLISNALSGLLVFTAVLSTTGRFRGWVLTALAAMAGNLAVAAINSQRVYHSLGASTAIFAGLGVLTGRAIRLGAQSRHPHRWRAMFIPFGAGATVLALYGAGGIQVDVLAHLAGFVSGLVAGFFAGLARGPKTDHRFSIRENKRGQ